MNEKQLVREYWNNCIGERKDEIATNLGRYLHEDTFWQGPHPINELKGTGALYSGFWAPFLRSFPDVAREPYIFMGGEFKGEQWISGNGYFRGIFTRDWLGIPATGRETAIRFGEFCKIDSGRISETYTILDIPDVMRQAGFDVLSPCLGEAGFAPGPKAGDGILLEEQDPAESERSLASVEAMLTGLSDYDESGNLDSMGQERFWHKEMLWYGPHGIGTTYGLKGFQEQHQRPFLEAFPDRKGGKHVCRHADGLYVASTGWPSLRGTHKGPYMGVPPTGRQFGMRVMDWWRRGGNPCERDLLKENWVLIDLIDFFEQIGVDLFDSLDKQLKGKHK